MTQSRDDLARRLIPGVTLSGDTASGPILDIDHAGHRARVSLFGGHIFAWQPVGYDPVLWVSSGTQFNRQRSIRGGTPICWPWFAVHPSHPDWPMHGFVRSTDWHLDQAETRDGAVLITLTPPPAARDDAYFPHPIRPTLAFAIGETLTITLTQANTTEQPIEIGQALHTYFQIGDIAGITITGLEWNAFIDKLEIPKDGGHREPEGAPITVRSEIDRIYRDLAGPITLNDHKLARAIEILHDGATNAVVWNPWIDKTIDLGDMGTPDAYRTMMCIETGNVPPDALVLAPSKTHSLKTTYRVTR